MDSPNYNNLGNRYAKENNYYNAYLAYQMAMSKDWDVITPLYNLSIIYQSLGLFNLALRKINKAIHYYENRRNPRYKYDVASFFSRRANIFRSLDQTNSMMKDIEKSFEHTKGYYFAWWLLAEFYAENCKFEDSYDAFTKAFLNSPNVIEILKNRGEIFLRLREYEKAAEDFKSAYALSKNKSWSSFYKLGYANYLFGDHKHAEEIFSAYKERYPYAVPYNEAGKGYGIIQVINKEKKFGFIFCPTVFNNHDSVYFRFSDCKLVPQIGDRVRYKLKYSEFKGKLTPKAVEVEPYRFLQERFKKQEIYHAIIQIKPDSVKACKGLEYVEIFYPQDTLLTLDSISNNIGMEIKQELSKCKYAFIEFKLVLDQHLDPAFSDVKLIPSFNTYSSKKVDTSSRQIKSYRGSSDRFCPVCGLSEWCGTEGCPNDPT